ncbi:MAG: hypothetical protein OXM03_04355 [Chloroflexota bacterium]|nr:hypothetical protein [Chloroflexota bacterium]
MVITGMHEMVPVKEIELDRANPRIRKFLEMYGDDPTPEQIFLALGAGGDDESSRQDGPTFQKLKQSIITNGGIIQPVILKRRTNGKLLCIEGNTRVAIYEDFLNRNVRGSWSTIPALVHDELDDAAVHAIRLQAHLVGPRPWDPYSKAKYLHDLRHNEHLPFSMIVDFCGGRQSEVSTFIDAYMDMEAYYRPIIADDGDFDTTRFSGFVELQKPGVKQAIAQAGFGLPDFAEWIRDEKLFPLRTVRVLPRILRNTKAREVFLKMGAREAEKVLDKPEIDKNLQDAALGQLARALTEKLATLPYEQYQRLRVDSTGDTVQALLDAQASLTEFLRELG